jgi:hypothetical protein
MKIFRLLALAVVVLMSLCIGLSGCASRTGGNLIINRLI